MKLFTFPATPECRLRPTPPTRAVGDSSLDSVGVHSVCAASHHQHRLHAVAIKQDALGKHPEFIIYKKVFKSSFYLRPKADRSTSDPSFVVGGWGFRLSSMQL